MRCCNAFIASGFDELKMGGDACRFASSPDAVFAVFKTVAPAIEETISWTHTWSILQKNWRALEGYEHRRTSSVCSRGVLHEVFGSFRIDGLRVAELLKTTYAVAIHACRRNVSFRSTNGKSSTRRMQDKAEQPEKNVASPNGKVSRQQEPEQHTIFLWLRFRSAHEHRCKRIAKYVVFVVFGVGLLIECAGLLTSWWRHADSGRSSETRRWLRQWASQFHQGHPRSK